MSLPWVLPSRSVDWTKWSRWSKLSQDGSCTRFQNLPAMKKTMSNTQKWKKCRKETQKTSFSWWFSARFSNLGMQKWSKRRRGGVQSHWTKLISLWIYTGRVRLQWQQGPIHHRVKWPKEWRTCFGPNIRQKSLRKGKTVLILRF